jgi:BlaI family penicillinase repressor
MAAYNISDAEWRVMQVVWERGRATAAEVISDLAGVVPWRHRTIRTLLARLVDKGVLAADTDGNRYVYRATVGRARCVRAEARSFLEKVFAGDKRQMLVHFVEDAKFTPEEIDELKRLLDEKRKPSR